MNKKQIEIFTAGCPVCEPIVALVKETACPNCVITVYNLSEQSENPEIMAKMNTYGIKRLPAIAVDENLIGCCKNVEITKNDLINAGIGNC